MEEKMEKNVETWMLDKVRRFVEEERMIEKGDKVLAGVSGGADSVCLFFVLRELLREYKGGLYVVHVNHGLRGEGAMRDEEFVKKLCEREGIPFEAVEADVKGRASGEGISTEEAGRLLRYEIFEERANVHGCNKIAVAHNENDIGETVLFQLFRGSGIRGLSGIAAKSGRLIRPLLTCGRDDIERYLEECGQGYCTDETNLTEEYSRNRIRLSVLPYVEKNINSRAGKHIVQSAGMLREISEYITKTAEMIFSKIVREENGEYYINLEKLKDEDIVIQKELLRMVLWRIAGHLRDISGEHIAMLLSLLQKEVGKQVDLPYGICGTKQYEEIRVRKNILQKPKNIFVSKKIIGGENEVFGSWYLPFYHLTLHLELMKYEKNLIIPKNRCTKWFDYDKIKNAVVIRTREKGDYFQMNEKGQKKTLKSYLIDQKIAEEERDTIPLLADGSHILWVLGRRSSEGYHIAEETKRILIAKIDGGIKYV